jgi:hypothetical protein
VAAGLAVTIGVAGTVQPAAAAERDAGAAPAVQAQASVITFDWTGLVIAAAGAILGGGGGGSGLEAAIQQIEAAIEQAKNDIIAHADAVAAADVQACVRAATIEFTNIDTYPPPVLMLWAQNLNGCAARASAYARTLVSRPAVDNIGYLIGPIYSMLLAAWGRAGLVNGVDLIIQDEVSAYEAVMAKLVPSCWHNWIFDDNPRVFEVEIFCEVYPGKVGKDIRFIGWPAGRPEPRVPYDRAIERADALTSRSIAIAALPRLRGVPRPVK